MNSELEEMINQMSFTQDMNYHSPEKLFSEILVRYLFQGESMKVIEDELLGTRRLAGWLSKSVLNYLGVDTSEAVRGMFKNFSVEEVVDVLKKQGSDQALVIAYYLSIYR